MANDAVIEGVEIHDFLPSRPLGAAGLESLARASNEFLRTGCAGTVGEIFAVSVPDAFAGGLAQRTGAASTLWAANLCVPTLTAVHTDLRCRVRVTVTGAGNGTVTFGTVTAADTLALASAAAGPVDLEGLITMSTATDYDEMTCTLTTTGGSTITVHGVWIWYEPLATPIAAGTNFDGAQPFGVTSSGADYTYDAMKTDAMVTLAEHVRDRPRVFWSWVAIASAVNGDGVMLDRIHRAWVTLHRGAQLAGVTYRIRINITASPGSVYLLAGNPAQWPNNRIPIAAAADGWLDTTFDVGSGYVVGDIPFPSMFLGLYPWDGAAAITGRTTVDVLSLTVWGI